MSDDGGNELNQNQLDLLARTLHPGALEASNSLARWIGRPAMVQMDSIEQLSIEDATNLLGEREAAICFCSMQIQGVISGEMILAFDDASGLALADLLLGRPKGQTTEWDELSESAVLETTNIVCCAFLNALSNKQQSTRALADNVPAPPVFRREFAESLLQFAFMDQLASSDRVVVCETRFHVDGFPVDWTLLLVPDAHSFPRLARLLAGEAPAG